MGATLAAHCCATEDEEGQDGQAAMKGIKKDTQPPTCYRLPPCVTLSSEICLQDVAFVSIPLDGKHMVEHLQGSWYRQGDAKHVGRELGCLPRSSPSQLDLDIRVASRRQPPTPMQGIGG